MAISQQTEELAAMVRACPGCAKQIELPADPKERQRHCPHCGALAWGASPERAGLDNARLYVMLARGTFLALAFYVVFALLFGGFVSVVTDLSLPIDGLVFGVAFLAGLITLWAYSLRQPIKAFATAIGVLCVVLIYLVSLTMVQPSWGESLGSVLGWSVTIGALLCAGIVGQNRLQAAAATESESLGSEH